MKICIFGDSVAKGVIYDEALEKYVFLKDCFVNLFSKGAGIPIKNMARFGCTIIKGQKILEKHIGQLGEYDYTILEFGGNDCNYDWVEIAKQPEKSHLPLVTSEVFQKTYSDIIKKVKACGSRPILLSLPPLNAQRFFNWVSQGLDKDKILTWLVDIDFIYRWQESYNLMIFQLAQRHDVSLLDIRKIFLEDRHCSDLICLDGMHPSKKGHELINSALVDLLI